MKISICAIIKNEHLYLKEWLLHHLDLGFDDIYLYEDYESDSHKDITSEFNNVHLNTVKSLGISQHDIFDKYNSIRQIKTYNIFLHDYKSQYDWILFIDIDEFLILDKGLDIKTLLEDYNDVQMLYIPWKMMGASGHIKHPNKSVVESYTEVLSNEVLDIGCMVKSFINTALHTDSWFCSGHTLGIQGYNIRKEPKMYPLIYEKMWLNHYFTKSWEDWILRFKLRGDLLVGNRKIELFFDLNPDMIKYKKTLMSQLHS